MNFRREKQIIKGPSSLVQTFLSCHPTLKAAGSRSHLWQVKFVKTASTIINSLHKGEKFWFECWELIHPPLLSAQKASFSLFYHSILVRIKNYSLQHKILKCQIKDRFMSTPETMSFKQKSLLLCLIKYKIRSEEIALENIMLQLNSIRHIQIKPCN